jgi:hypothetical protein
LLIYYFINLNIAKLIHLHYWRSRRGLVFSSFCNTTIFILKLLILINWVMAAHKICIYYFVTYLKAAPKFVIMKVIWGVQPLCREDVFISNIVGTIQLTSPFIFSRLKALRYLHAHSAFFPVRNLISVSMPDFLIMYGPYTRRSIHYWLANTSLCKILLHRIVRIFPFILSICNVCLINMLPAIIFIFLTGSYILHFYDTISRYISSAIFQTCWGITSHGVHLIFFWFGECSVLQGKPSYLLRWGCWRLIWMFIYRPVAGFFEAGCIRFFAVFTARLLKYPLLVVAWEFQISIYNAWRLLVHHFWSCMIFYSAWVLIRVNFLKKLLLTSIIFLQDIYIF